jgi:hypothetical protein
MLVDKDSPAFWRLVLRLPWPSRTWRALTERRCSDLKKPSGILLGALLASTTLKT